MNAYTTKILLIIILFSGCIHRQKRVQKASEIHEFERVHYNNPEAAPFLGVGLWAWPLPMDYDGDGDYDLLVSCRDKPFGGTYFFENKDGSAYPTFAKPIKIGEGLKDIQICYVHGEPRLLQPGIELRHFILDFNRNKASLFPTDTFSVMHKSLRFNQWKYVDYEGDGDLDIVVGIQDGEDYGWDNAFDENGNWVNGPLHGYVYLVENNNGHFRLKGKILADGSPVDVYGAPSPNFADFDNDGDLDLICGEFIDKFTWFENIGSRSNPQYAAGKYLKIHGKIITMDLEMILPVALDWDNDGDVDLIVGDEDGRVAYLENTGKTEGNMPVFHEPKYFIQQPEYLKFGALATPVSTDWDDDGDEDLVCGNSAGYIAFIENLDGGDPPKWAKPKKLLADGKVIRIQAGKNGSIQGPCEAKWGYTTLAVADWNNDGRKDILFNSIWGKVGWYQNIGNKGAYTLTPARPVKVKWIGPAPKPRWNWWAPQAGTLATQWRTTPYAIDWNKDGLMDLVMLDQEGYLSFYERIKTDSGLVLLPGQRIFYSKSSYDRKNKVITRQEGPLRLNDAEAGHSGRRKFTFTDWDGDGDFDLLVNSTNVALYVNTGTKNGRVYFELKGDLGKEKLAGHSTSPTTVDWDQNGIPDLLVGAEDGHFYFLKNTHQ